MQHAVQVTTKRSGHKATTRMVDMNCVKPPGATSPERQFAETLFQRSATQPGMIADQSSPHFHARMAAMDITSCMASACSVQRPSHRPGR